MHEIGIEKTSNNHSYDDDETSSTLPTSQSTDRVTGKQLLYNYCYGHPESSLLFYSTGLAISFINHSNKLNAKLV